MPEPHRRRHRLVGTGDPPWAGRHCIERLPAAASTLSPGFETVLFTHMPPALFSALMNPTFALMTRSAIFVRAPAGPSNSSRCPTDRGTLQPNAIRRQTEHRNHSGIGAKIQAEYGLANYTRPSLSAGLELSGGSIATLPTTATTSGFFLCRERNCSAHVELPRNNSYPFVS